MEVKLRNTGPRAAKPIIAWSRVQQLRNSEVLHQWPKAWNPRLLGFRPTVKTSNADRSRVGLESKAIHGAGRCIIEPFDTEMSIP